MTCTQQLGAEGAKTIAVDLPVRIEGQPRDIALKRLTRNVFFFSLCTHQHELVRDNRARDSL